MEFGFSKAQRIYRICELVLTYKVLWSVQRVSDWAMFKWWLWSPECTSSLVSPQSNDQI